MARGRIFSSRRMFSTRRDAFAEPSRNAGPMGVMLGLMAAGIIIFAIGVYIGAKFPSTFGFGATVPAPVATTPAETEAPAVTFAPETPAEPVPDTAMPEATTIAPVEASPSVPAAAASVPEPAHTSPVPVTAPMSAPVTGPATTTEAPAPKMP